MYYSIVWLSSVAEFQAYEDEVRSKGTGVNRSLHRLFDTLAGRGATAYSGKSLVNF